MMTSHLTGLTVNDVIGRIECLGSSSSGNAFIVEIKVPNREKPFTLGIELGFPYKEYLNRLWNANYNLDDIDAFLVTHEHKDHSEAVKEMVKRGKVVYAPRTVFDKHDIKVDDKYVFDKEYTNKNIYDNYIKVLGFPLEHYDEKDNGVYNLGYIIKVANDFRILFVIDTKYIKQDLTKYQFNMIFIETNYIKRNAVFALAEAKEKQDIGNIVRYNRLFNSHMSLEMASYILFGDKRHKIIGFDLSRCELIIQTHLSSNWGTNAQYYNQYFKIKSPKHIKILTALRTRGFIG